MRNLIAFIFFAAVNTACDSVEKEISEPVVLTEEVWKKPSGTPDIPRGDFEITSAGMGKYILGDSIGVAKGENVSAFFVESLGLEWPARKIDLGSGEWIILESTGTVGQATLIRTNSPQMISRRGFRVGMKLPDVMAQDSLMPDKQYRLIHLFQEKISIKLDKSSESDLFDKGLNFTDISEKARVEEIVIICGDC